MTTQRLVCSTSNPPARQRSTPLGAPLLLKSRAAVASAPSVAGRHCVLQRSRLHSEPASPGRKWLLPAAPQQPAARHAAAAERGAPKALRERAGTARARRRAAHCCVRAGAQRRRRSLAAAVVAGKSAQHRRRAAGARGCGVRVRVGAPADRDAAAAGVGAGVPGARRAGRATRPQRPC